MASILPQGKTQFFNAIGVPLDGGSVYTYVPGTTTPAKTWQNQAQTIANSNPITLDSSGSCLLWGVGAYRLQVYDGLGVLESDTVSYSPVIPNADGTITATPATNANELITLGQAQTDFAAINGSASEAFNVSNLYASTGVFGNIQVFTSSGTFTVPAGVPKIRLTVVGGGAAGSSCNGTTVGGGGFSGAGGGAGGAAIGIYSVTPGTAYTVTVGAAQTTSNAAGNTSSFGSLASATGGEAVAFFPSATISAGSGGGTGSGGSINIGGGYGSDGQAGTAVFAGNGGNSIFGGGGRAGNNGGVGGQTFGAGGGGAYNGTSGLGGAGAAGIVIVEW